MVIDRAELVKITKKRHEASQVQLCVTVCLVCSMAYLLMLQLYMTVCPVRLV